MAKPSRPQGSKVGLAHIKTPLLSHELEGAAYWLCPLRTGKKAATALVRGGRCTWSLKTPHQERWSEARGQGRTERTHTRGRDDVHERAAGAV